MTTNDAILTVAEVAADVRCSKAHVHHAIHGEVAGVTPLPAIRMGRRKLVCRSALERWTRLNEQCFLDRRMRAGSEIDAGGPVRGESHGP